MRYAEVSFFTNSNKTYLYEIPLGLKVNEGDTALVHVNGRHVTPCNVVSIKNEKPLDIERLESIDAVVPPGCEFPSKKDIYGKYIVFTPNDVKAFDHSEDAFKFIKDMNILKPLYVVSEEAKDYIEKYSDSITLAFDHIDDMKDDKDLTMDEVRDAIRFKIPNGLSLSKFALEELVELYYRNVDFDESEVLSFDEAQEYDASHYGSLDYEINDIYDIVKRFDFSDNHIISNDNHSFEQTKTESNNVKHSNVKKQQKDGYNIELKNTGNRTISCYDEQEFFGFAYEKATERISDILNFNEFDLAEFTKAGVLLQDIESKNVDKVVSSLKTDYGLKIEVEMPNGKSDDKVRERSDDYER